MLCFKEHKNHSYINFENIMLDEEENKKEINKLEEYLNKFNNNIDDVIKLLN